MRLGSVADQATGRGELAPLIDRRYGMACRQRDELLAPTVEEWVGADDQRAGLKLDERGEGGVDLALGAGLQDRELHPLRARRFLHVSDHGLGIRIVRVHEESDHLGLGDQLGQQLEPLGHQLRGQNADAREVAARPGKAGDQTLSDRVGAEEDNRDRRGCAFAARAAGGAGHDHVDLAADEVGGQCGQPIIATLRPAVFDRHILSLDIAGFAQSLAERGHKRCSRAGRSRCEVADYRHRLLLRAHGARCCYRAAHQEHQLAAFHHSMTSSARARIDGGTVRPSALAVLRLTTSSNVVGCWTGRSAGLAPLRIFPA